MSAFSSTSSPLIWIWISLATMNLPSSIISELHAEVLAVDLTLSRASVPVSHVGIVEFAEVHRVERYRPGDALGWSGREWVSSVELENAIMAHPKILEAAVIGLAHPKWDERPVAFAVPRPEFKGKVTEEEVIEFLKGQGRQVVAARRGALHRGGAQDVGRQVRQEAAPCERRPHEGERGACLAKVGARAGARARDRKGQVPFQVGQLAVPCNRGR